ncbi:MAG: 4-hydroxy-tetrahydrodipicolinate reductase [Bacteroidota bacterium]
MEKKMKLAIIGFGKMGKALASAVTERGAQVCAIIDPVADEATAREISREALVECDVALDFSRPDAVLSNIRALSSIGKDIVVGTTGWYDKLEEAREVVKRAGNGMIWSGNFSLGVQIFFQLLEHSAGVIDRFTEYDAGVQEIHHSQKMDSPSGTAGMIGEILLRKISRKKSIVKGNSPATIKPEQLQIVSQRIGSVPGTHTVMFDGPDDSIELKHTARGRQGFASGALAAAEWVRGRKGFFDIHDLISDLLQEK